MGRLIERRRATDWLDDVNKKPGFNKNNLYYLREYKQLYYDFGALNMILYYMLNHKILNNLCKLLRSTVKQKILMRHINKDLKKYLLEDKDVKYFDLDLRAYHDRIDWIKKILYENLKLTKYYPYFRDHDFSFFSDRAADVMRSYDISDMDDNRFDSFLSEELEKYESEHGPEMEAYLESVSDKIKIKEENDERRAQILKAEKLEKQKEKERIRKEIRDEKCYKEERKKELAKMNKQDRYYYGLAAREKNIV